MPFDPLELNTESEQWS